MKRIKHLPFGTWPSFLSAADIGSGRLRFGDLVLTDQAVFWSESVPEEKGRMTIMRRDHRGETETMLAAPFSVGSRVHEYGGGAFAVFGADIFFSNKTDNAIYRRRSDGGIVKILGEENCRYADLQVHPNGKYLFAVREEHLPESQPQSSLVLIPLQSGPGMMTLFSGTDFCASPAVSPDGTKLAFLTWNHPDMPWDATRLLIGTLDSEGGNHHWEQIAGGNGESIFQPQWQNNNRLIFMSDRNGWWNPWYWQAGNSEPIVEAEIECGLPQWVFAMSTSGFDNDGNLICAWRNGIEWKLSKIVVSSGDRTDIPLAMTWIDQVRTSGSKVAFWAGSAMQSQALTLIDAESADSTIVRRSMQTMPDPAEISLPEEIEVGHSVNALLYPPTNSGYSAPSGEKPPLIVMCHSGPTASVDKIYDPRRQFWTSRGFAVADVNYRGSTGRGRAFREALNGKYGEIDAQDCRAVAQFLIARGAVDPQKVVIRGSSSGGYTALRSIVDEKLFCGACSLYGISDLESLVHETHKFEAHYFDRLIARFPEEIERYRQLSPIRLAASITTPVLLLQGSDDQVVPPSQSRRMFKQLAARGVAVAYLELPGEGHGFRNPENVALALETELAFYLRIMGLENRRFDSRVELQNL